MAEINDVDLVIHAGDVFDEPNPSHSAMMAAAEPLLRIAAGGRPVVIVPGNHERSTLPAFLLLSHPNIHIVREPVTLTFNLRGTRVGVAALPCIRRRSAHLFEGALRATGWERAGADVNILAAHQTFESATCGPVGYRFHSGDDVIERTTIPTAFDYVAAGHIHRHQVLIAPVKQYVEEGESLHCEQDDKRDGPPIVYAGSPDRITMAERDEPKGAVLIESRGAELHWRFIEHEVRPMRLAPVNLSGLSRAGIMEELARHTIALPPECIASFRLSGETSRGTMRGLRLTETVRSLRPDVDFSLSVQAIEYVPERVIERTERRETVSIARDEMSGTGEAETSMSNVTSAEDIELLREVGGKIPIEEIKAVPTGCGTYIFSDRFGRVLYIGKANRVRTRVRTHLSAKTAAAHFAGWTRQITHVRVRAAQSELEALLVEAELIRRLRPPFNRQMRLWSRYSYICRIGEEADASGTLGWGECAVSSDPCDEGTCFGPFRSRGGAQAILEAANDFFGLAQCPTENLGRYGERARSGRSSANLCERYFRGTCTGLCAERIGPAEYAKRVSQRDALLSGLDDGSLLGIEKEIEAIKESLAAGGEMTDAQREIARRVQTLRSAFDFTAIVRMAAGLRGGALLLPGAGNGRVAVLLGDEGIRVRVLPSGASTDWTADSETVVLLHNHAKACDIRRRTWLPKAVADCYVTAARNLAQGSRGCEFIAKDVILGGMSGTCMRQNQKCKERTETVSKNHIIP